RARRCDVLLQKPANLVQIVLAELLGEASQYLREHDDVANASILSLSSIRRLYSLQRVLQCHDVGKARRGFPVYRAPQHFVNGRWALEGVKGGRHLLV